jgi:hypothetical protein
MTGNLNLNNNIPTNIGAGTAAAPAICAGGDVNTGIFSPAADNWAVATNGSERIRVDSTGKVGIGGITTPVVFIEAGRDANDSLTRFRLYNSNAGSSAISQVELGNDTNAAASAIRVNSSTNTGTAGANGLSIINGLNAALTLGTNGLERMRINNLGSVTFGTTNELPGSNNVAGAAFYRGEGLLQLSRATQPAFAVNRITNDGDLAIFQQDGITEGSISVSGSTVAYNGAHLSRWSQLPTGVERSDILRGTVLSNIDEMCEWGTELNEQLNRMKVSDVEGDANVAGVFQSWDDDDKTYINDFYCAMTGDFIIRISAGVTVERGDLLMSAGDGTAKPQDDDIIRSKTIAKVTSFNVTCTYDDGSYCVPCVLMAC